MPEEEILELIDPTVSEELDVVAYRNGELTYLSIGYVQIALPNQVFDEVCQVITNYYRKSHPNKLAT